MGSSGWLARPAFSSPGKLLDFCRKAHADSAWGFRGSLAPLADPIRFAQFLSEQYRAEWVVHIEPPTASPERVLKYLARYTYRVAITNERIASIANGQVTFRYKDHAQQGRWRTMTLSAPEFLRRFLTHVLPKGLMRIRPFGFLAGPHRPAQLTRCRALLHATAPATGSPLEASPPPAEDGRRCTRCGRGLLYLVADLPRPTVNELVCRTYEGRWYDSS